jgi:hypothetical protein
MSPGLESTLISDPAGATRPGRWSIGRLRLPIPRAGEAGPASVGTGSAADYRCNGPSLAAVPIFCLSLPISPYLGAHGAPRCRFAARGDARGCPSPGPERAMRRWGGSGSGRAPSAVRAVSGAASPGGMGQRGVVGVARHPGQEHGASPPLAPYHGRRSPYGVPLSRVCACGGDSRNSPTRLLRRASRFSQSWSQERAMGVCDSMGTESYSECSATCSHRWRIESRREMRRPYRLSTMYRCLYDAHCRIADRARRVKAEVADSTPVTSASTSSGWTIQDKAALQFRP